MITAELKGLPFVVCDKLVLPLPDDTRTPIFIYVSAALVSLYAY